MHADNIRRRGPQRLSLRLCGGQGEAHAEGGVDEVVVRDGGAGDEVEQEEERVRPGASGRAEDTEEGEHRTADSALLSAPAATVRAAGMLVSGGAAGLPPRTVTMTCR